MSLCSFVACKVIRGGPAVNVIFDANRGIFNGVN